MEFKHYFMINVLVFKQFLFKENYHFSLKNYFNFFISSKFKKLTDFNYATRHLYLNYY